MDLDLEEEEQQQEDLLIHILVQEQVMLMLLGMEGDLEIDLENLERDPIMV